MGTLHFSFLPGNNSRPKSKCNIYSWPLIVFPPGEYISEEEKTGQGIRVWRLGVRHRRPEPSSSLHVGLPALHRLCVLGRLSSQVAVYEPGVQAWLLGHHHAQDLELVLAGGRAGKNLEAGSSR